MRSILIAAIVVLSAALGACSTTPDEQTAAPVDEGKQSTSPGASTQPVRPPTVASVDLTAGKPGAGAAALRDPNNILSRRSIYYDLDQFNVKDQYRELVEAHARYLRSNPQAKMLIQGNTDERGSREYNVSLGQKRSEGVKKMMLLLGAREDQIESVSLGEEKPADAGHDETAWSKNRRSDILYNGEY